MVKTKTIILLVFALLFVSVLTAYADEKAFNPSFYSAAEMSLKLPSFWIANYIEVLEFLKDYPDFLCEHYSNEYQGAVHDQIVCESVNNKRTRDVIINFFFEGDHAGMTGLQEVVFTVSTPHPQDIQDVFEYFWSNEAFPQHNDDDEFYHFPSLIFHTPDTVMRFDFPQYNIEGLDYMTVDFWDRSMSRLGVG